MSSIIRATTTSGLQVAPDNSGSLQLQTNGTTAAVTIDTSQNVGIGTTSPTEKLEIVASSPASLLTSNSTTGYSISRFRNTATSGRTYEWTLGGSGTGAQAGAMYLYDATAGAVRMQIDSSGNVGIGTTSPSTQLQVSGASSNIVSSFGNLAAFSNNSQAVDLGGSISLGGVYTGTSIAQWAGIRGAKENSTDGNYAGYMSFFTRPNGGSNTERMRIDSSGNVGIGTASPNEKLEVNGNIYLNNGNADGAQITFASNGFSAWNIDNSSGNFRCYYGSTEYFTLSTTGTITSLPTYNNTAAGSTVVVTSAGLIRRTSSSLKYKKDVETLEQTIVDNAVNNLRPVWYRTKNAEGDDKATWSHIGLIAEEVDLVEPRLVKYRTAEVTQDENGANITTELETPVPEDVDYAKLSVILLAKVKQLEARIAVLEAK